MKPWTRSSNFLTLASVAPDLFEAIPMKLQQCARSNTQLLERVRKEKNGCSLFQAATWPPGLNATIMFNAWDSSRRQLLHISEVSQKQLSAQSQRECMACLFDVSLYRADQTGDEVHRRNGTIRAIFQNKIPCADSKSSNQNRWNVLYKVCLYRGNLRKGCWGLKSDPEFSSFHGLRSRYSSWKDRHHLSKFPHCDEI